VCFALQDDRLVDLGLERAWRSIEMGCLRIHGRYSTTLSGKFVPELASGVHDRSCEQKLPIIFRYQTYCLGKSLGVFHGTEIIGGGES
jgi:hypothetical protein